MYVYAEAERYVTPALAPIAPQLIDTVLVTVILSGFARGVSARPGAAWYGRKMDALNQDVPELRVVPQRALTKRRIG